MTASGFESSRQSTDFYKFRDKKSQRDLAVETREKNPTLSRRNTQTEKKVGKGEKYGSFVTFYSSADQSAVSYTLLKRVTQKR